MQPFIAQFVFNQSGTVVDLISGAWDEVWTMVIGGALWLALCNLGVAFGVFGLVVWTVQLFQSLLDDATAKPFSRLIVPIILCMLLVNGGALLGDVVFTFRGVINDLNAQILEVAAAGNNAEQALRDLGSYPAAESAIYDLRRRCDAITDNEALVICLDETRAQAEALIDQFEEQNQTLGGDWMETLRQIALSAFNVVNPAAGMAFRFMPSIITLQVESFLMGMQAAFQALIEVSFLLTGLLAPLSVGLSFFPMGSKPIFLWVTAFWSLGFCKICLNIVSALVAEQIARVGPSETLAFSIFVGLLAPILAFALSAGGGLAIFNGINRAAIGVTTTVARAAVFKSLH
ncbi:hypothetical protein ACQ4M4_25540 [Leptolyngbya sp. AN02str]|uniref:hypothetical protein n=1 Tax=Leptolyngbya sp. AN02str TaxID=3423363 RepID=UPI003D320F58